MARKVFFSFHYKDILLVSQIRNSGQFKRIGETQKFYDHAEWETLKRTRPRDVTNWINSQIKGSSVTCVLIGGETASRKWVNYEIEKTMELHHGIVGIDLYGMKSPAQQLLQSRGKNPLDGIQLSTGKSLSAYFKTYDWVKDNGYANIDLWIEEALKSIKP